jgi:hypothetical protein
VRADRPVRPSGAGSITDSDPNRRRNRGLGRRRNDGCATEFPTTTQPPRNSLMGWPYERSQMALVGVSAVAELAAIPLILLVAVKTKNRVTIDQK